MLCCVVLFCVVLCMCVCCVCVVRAKRQYACASVCVSECLDHFGVLMSELTSSCTHTYTQHVQAVLQLLLSRVSAGDVRADAHRPWASDSPERRLDRGAHGPGVYCSLDW